MKNNKLFALLGTLAFVLVFGFVVVGCATGSSPNTNEPESTTGSSPNNEPKSIKITGITFTDTNGAAGVQLFREPKFGGNSIAREEYKSVQINDGELIADLKVSEGWNSTDASWTGSGKYYICLMLAHANGWADDGGGTHIFWWAKDGKSAEYDIQDAVTTLEFSQFKQ
jgi:hypothetical protein